MISLIFNKKKSQKNLFCFSPEIMLATFTVEFILAGYSYFKYRTTRFGRGVIATLLLLGIFQLSEFYICRNSNPLFWSRVGFFSITLLPVLGLYLVSIVKRTSVFIKMGYVFAAGFALYYLLMPKSIEGAVCGGNYVIFNGSRGLYVFYGFYYFGFLFLAMWEAFEGIKGKIKNTILKKILFWFIIGYLSFVLPLSLVYIFIAGSRIAVASIMCGFAIVFAFILTFKIAPYYNKLSHYIGKIIEVKIDRPKGSKHPKHSYIYPINYGYIPGIKGLDGEEIGVYILGINKPIKNFKGKCIVIIEREDDNDDKLVVVPDGTNFTDKNIQEITYFQEKYFNSKIIR